MRVVTLLRLGRRVAGLAVLLALAATLSAQPAAGQEGRPATLLRIDAATPQQRTALVRLGIDVVQADSTGLVAWVTPAQRRALEAAGLAPVLLPQPDFAPTVDQAYHYYEGALAALQQTAAQYPHITSLETIGHSDAGLPIQALHITRQPADGAPKPGVLIFGLTHAREHLTTEMALYVIQVLTSEYGREAAITNLVNQRDIWIVPVANPDGCVYDIQGGYYHYWRKSRRRNGDGSYGVDLNRNYGYLWGCCNGSSPLTYDDDYRGPAPFSETETQAIRDFVLAHPNLTASLSLHAFSELILWPYGYTYDALPAGMDTTDHGAFVAIGQEMARRNGYRAMQASGLYITDGSSDDWLYAERRLFAFTIEMFPRDSTPGFYPPGNVIERETRRNRSAVEYFLAIADHPRKVVGAGGDTAAPQVALSQPAAGAYAVGALRLQAQASDDVAVTLVEFLADGQSIGIDAEPPYELTWDGQPAVGVVSLQARAFDAGQNIATTQPLAIHRSTVPVLRWPLFMRRYGRP